MACCPVKSHNTKDNQQVFFKIIKTEDKFCFFWAFVTLERCYSFSRLVVYTFHTVTFFNFLGISYDVVVRFSEKGF